MSVRYLENNSFQFFALFIVSCLVVLHYYSVKFINMFLGHLAMLRYFLLPRLKNTSLYILYSNIFIFIVLKIHLEFIMSSRNLMFFSHVII